MQNSLPSFGRYEVQRELGSGGMAKVYLARDPNLNRLVAIKSILTERLEDKNVAQRFFIEAMTAARLNSPNIIEIHDFDVDAGNPYIVMEHINGPTLDEVCNKVSPNTIPQEIVVAIISQIAEGLEVASQRGIIHRDIKPANIMITAQGYVKIMDFGIAHLKDLSITRTQGLIGPPAFMSPEQVNGIKPLTAQSDMFALGTMFYLLLTGTHPFVADGYSEIFARILNETPQPVRRINSKIDIRLEALIKTLLCKNPLERGQGPNWLKKELQSFLYLQRVVSPTEKIREYISKINSQTFSTTHISPREIERAAKAFKGKTSRLRPPEKTNQEMGFKRVILAFVIMIFISGLIGAGLWYYRQPDNTIHAVTVKAKIETPKVNTIQPVKLSEIKPETTTVSTVPENKPDTNPHIAPLKKPQTQKPEKKLVEVCSISILTSPPFADIFLDGKRFGTAPMVEEKSPCGRHRLFAKTLMGEVADTVIYLKSGNLKMTLTLVAKVR